MLMVLHLARRVAQLLSDDILVQLVDRVDLVKCLIRSVANVVLTVNSL